MLQLKFKKQKQKQNKTENLLTISQNLEKDHKIENSDFKDPTDFMINLDMHYSNKELFQSKNNQFRRTNQQKTYENKTKIKKKPIKMNFQKLVEKDRIIYVDDDEEKHKFDKNKKIIDLNKMSNIQNQKFQLQLKIIQSTIFRLFKLR
ncbi:unnamed protein product [Paramecium sonneborni]|uniref:Uncharacterized protein n=1 Tax=Paramecium sonneborni TaxID=65129 RepID=A0A8S1KV61_9CILI|nr:unnamed protein product [Paramecium sonneborni]